MAKHFVFGGKQDLSRQDILNIENERQQAAKTAEEIQDEQSRNRLFERDNLIHVDGKIIVKVDIRFKNSHTFEDGTKIRLERGFNNFNRRESQPVNCIVISADGIPVDAEILVEHNALHETNRINDYKASFENDGSDRIRYYSVFTTECFAWRLGTGEWNPIPPFEFGLRVFKPYEGLLHGIKPKLLKDTLYVTSGELKGEVVKTLKACDYEIIFQGTNGREESLICFRPFGDEKTKMEEEAIAILHDETQKVKSGELLIGYTISDSKKLNDAN